MPGVGCGLLQQRKRWRCEQCCKPAAAATALRQDFPGTGKAKLFLRQEHQAFKIWCKLDEGHN